ncbi:alpha/beta hydrolase [Thiocapsa imhoffii]|uniref:Alpha/beta hydrolase n=1 Tax=Thiocapsa imhoffii TaxID=382777 RepID=A0A9X1B9Y9_9GAMM|nr:alpha/beta hydrolase [Thiocapsa imhoffii]MBK1646412.1 alpha/beta hydrolase [Thiocapsa imhoffii]
MDFSTSGRITLADGPLAYRQTPSGRPPLLLIHGWGGSSRHWLHTAADLADIRTLYACDLPGHGDSPARPTQTDAHDLAALIIAFADRLGLDRFDLDGHSWGAAIAVLVAAHWPERVDRLILTSLGIARNPLEQFMVFQLHQQFAWATALGRPWLQQSRPWFSLMQPMLAWLGSQPEFYRALAARMLHQLPENEEPLRLGVQEFLGTDPLTAWDSMIAASSPAILGALEKLNTPTLLINADADRIMPVAGSRALAKRIPHVRSVELAQCGHLPMLERPQDYQRLVRAFLLDGQDPER